MSMFPVVHPKSAMHDAFFIFLISLIQTQQCTIFLSIEQEDIHTEIIIQEGDVSFLIFMSQK